MQAYCWQCKFDFDVPDASGQRVKCIVCGQPCEVTDDAGVPIKRKKTLSDGARRCAGCGKALARGATYCVGCGVHNYDVGKALGATLEKAECEREEDEDEIVFWRLVRILRRLLRIDSPAAPPPRGD
jgi:hypothetical protein